MNPYLIRFMLGGIVVSIFAMIGDVLRPKSFAGLFGAAPSVALATVGLTIHSNGSHYVAIEARSMILGALCFMIYAALVCKALMCTKASALKATIALFPVWFGSSFLLWWLVMRCV
jgi:hypothetical protein